MNELIIPNMYSKKDSIEAIRFNLLLEYACANRQSFALLVL